MIHVAVEQLAKGDMMVVAPTSPPKPAISAICSRYRAGAGGVGLVIDAGVRDIAIWPNAVPGLVEGRLRARHRQGDLGSVNVPVVCAGALVNPGDVIVADDDGVCVVRREDAAAVLEKARERIANEESKRKRLASGELGLDLYNMRPRLAEKGLKYV